MMSRPKLSNEKSNRGRPKAGFEFVEPNELLRYATKNFEQKPSQRATTIYESYLEGLTIRMLAEDYGMPKSNVARILKNVEEWNNEQDLKRR